MCLNECEYGLPQSRSIVIKLKGPIRTQYVPLLRSVCSAICPICASKMKVSGRDFFNFNFKLDCKCNVYIDPVKNGHKSYLYSETQMSLAPSS